MDECANLTLHIARFAQMPSDSTDAPREWVFMPEGVRASTWAGAADVLAQAPKPLLVAPLQMPGMLGTWSVQALEGDARRRTEHEFANLREFIDERATEFGLVNNSRICFGSAAGILEITLTELRRWAREYGVIVGLLLRRDPDDVTWLTIRQSDATWSRGGPDRHPGSAT